MELFLLLIASAFCVGFIKESMRDSRKKKRDALSEAVSEFQIARESKRVAKYEAESQQTSEASESGEFSYEVIGADDTEQSPAPKHHLSNGNASEKDDLDVLFSKQDWSELQRPAWLRKKARSESNHLSE